MYYKYHKLIKKLYPNSSIIRELYPNGREYNGMWEVSYTGEVWKVLNTETSLSYTFDYYNRLVSEGILIKYHMTRSEYSEWFDNKYGK